MLQRPLLAPLDERANRRGRGVENVHPVTFNDVPEAIRLGPVGRAFIHKRRRAVRQRAINNVAVTGDPPDICGAPINVFVLNVEDPFCGEMCLQQVAAGRMENAFWLSRRTGCVKNEERMFAVQFFGGTIRIDSSHQFMPPMIATGFHMNLAAGTANHNA